jgi:hypothetical protein
MLARKAQKFLIDWLKIISAPAACERVISKKIN